jgi:hypothetical protein
MKFLVLDGTVYLHSVQEIYVKFVQRHDDSALVNVINQVLHVRTDA